MEAVCNTVNTGHLSSEDGVYLSPFIVSTCLLVGRMFVCMYVRMYICMYVCMYLCMYVQYYVCMYVCTYLYIYLSMQLFHSPFAVVLDHRRKSLVVAIRGSLSMEVRHIRMYLCTYVTAGNIYNCLTYIYVHGCLRAYIQYFVPSYVWCRKAITCVRTCLCGELLRNSKCDGSYIFILSRSSLCCNSFYHTHARTHARTHTLHTCIPTFFS